MRFHPPRDWPAAPFWRTDWIAGAYVSGVVEDAADTSIGEIVVAAFNGDDNDVQTEQLAAIAPAAGGAPVSSQRTTENVPEPPSPIPPAIASLAAQRDRRRH